MRLHRFYLEQMIPKEGEITLTDTELIHQLVNVFRFKVGQHLVVFDGSGFEYEAEIVLLNKKEVKLKIIKINQGFTLIDSVNKKVSLYLSLIKKNNFELAVEKCTEVGVAEIHPIISERSEKKDLNLERLNKIVKEASEQSGRMTLPKVFEITDLEKAVSEVVKEGKEGVVFHTATSPGIGMPPSPRLRRGLFQDSPLLSQGEGLGVRLCLFVGPEGGFSEKEIDLFRQNNFKILSLGQNVLRAETAAVVAVWEALKM